MIRHFITGLLGLGITLISACESYDFSVNEKVVYTPKPLFRDYTVADEPLRTCIEQAIKDSSATSASELKTLICSHAGITSIAGIETFTGITRLNLAANTIIDISPLAALSSLEILLLADNQIIDTTPLLELPALREVNLNANPQLLCPSGTSLISLETLTLPARCD